MSLQEVKVPDIGNFKDVAVIEVSVRVGDSVSADQTIITLESDKATLDVPCPTNGIVKELKVKIGDQVSEGTVILLLEVTEKQANSLPIIATEETRQPSSVVENSTHSARSALMPDEEAKLVAIVNRTAQENHSAKIDESAFAKSHASPSVRRFARELGVDLSKVVGSGRKNRVLQTDIQAFVKQAMTKGIVQQAVSSGMGIPEVPEIDFSQFGEIEVRALGRIRKLSGASLHRSWLNIPHVTQFEEADISDLEDFRKNLAEEGKKRNIKVTLLAFLLKACCTALKMYPDFNSSLDRTKENLIMKKYFHIGVAVDTAEGLIVPVIRDVNTKGLWDLADELGKISEKARNKKLSPKEMQGACFTISSLGGIGGTAFTPIINAPEVAILGVSRASMKPVYQNGQFVPRLLLPLSLSYDHRVIDGAAAARFTSYLSFILGDVRRLLL